MGEGGRSGNTRRGARPPPCCRSCGARRSRWAAGCPSPRSALSPTCWASLISASTRSRPSTRCSISRRSDAITCRSAARRRAGCAAPMRSRQPAGRLIGEPGHMTPDGLFSWTEVECLGACVNAPMAQINKDYYEDLTPENFARILKDLKAGRPVTPGPQNGRQTSAPEGGPITLIDPALYAKEDPDEEMELVGAGGRSYRPRRQAPGQGRQRARARRAEAARSARAASRGASDAAGQGPHLQESLRPPQLAAEGRARARRLGRHRGDDRARARGDHRGGKGVRLARPRRRGLPHRPQMVVHAKAIGRPSELSRDQCGRVRAWYLQGPGHHAARPAAPDRGRAARGLRHARAHGLHLHTRGVHPRARAAAGGDRRSL